MLEQNFAKWARLCKKCQYFIPVVVQNCYSMFLSPSTSNKTTEGLTGCFFSAVLYQIDLIWKTTKFMHLTLKNTHTKNKLGEVKRIRHTDSKPES